MMLLVKLKTHKGLFLQVYINLFKLAVANMHSQGQILYFISITL